MTLHHLIVPSPTEVKEVTTKEITDAQRKYDPRNNAVISAERIGLEWLKHGYQRKRMTSN